MKLVPADSLLRRVPTSVERRTVLYLDGIRYSIESFELSSLRLARVLDQLAKRTDDTPDLGDLILEATTDAWSMIDAVHRLRELLSQLPGLRKNEPELQVFLRGTAVIEDLRHFFQHFRTEIDSFHERGMPLWGTLSWAHTDAESELPENHTIVPGTFFRGAWVATCTFDTHEGRYVERVLLHAGPKKVDLATLTEQVERFVAWYVAWFERSFTSDDRLGADVHMKFQLRPVSPDEEGSDGE